MGEVLLQPAGEIDIMIEAEVINPGIMAGKSQEQIESLPVWQGQYQHPLSRFFDVDVAGIGAPGETSIIIEGDVCRAKRIGQGMTAGKIEIRGSAGMHLGSEMAGGTITVR
ncbi:MAG: formylmethanofuran dehydrogenase subunit C, partial [Methanosarcinales archaeon]|nr:formylmethanofuran dehydrogenase subunit C [Methanosarcinales archaeon]